MIFAKIKIFHFGQDAVHLMCLSSSVGLSVGFSHIGKNYSSVTIPPCLCITPEDKFKKSLLSLFSMTVLIK